MSSDVDVWSSSKSLDHWEFGDASPICRYTYPSMTFLKPILPLRWPNRRSLCCLIILIVDQPKRIEMKRNPLNFVCFRHPELLRNYFVYKKRKFLLLT